MKIKFFSILSLLMVNFSINAQNQTINPQNVTSTYIHTLNPILKDEIKKVAYFKGRNACKNTQQNLESHNPTKITQKHHRPNLIKINEA